jgi:hypothetical protein
METSWIAVALLTEEAKYRYFEDTESRRNWIRFPLKTGVDFYSWTANNKFWMFNKRFWNEIMGLASILN